MSHPTRQNGPNGLQRVADFAVLVALIFPVIFGLTSFVNFLQIGECPTGSFQAGPLHANYFVLGLMAVTLPLVFIMQHCLYHLMPITQKWLDKRLRCTPRRHFIWGSLALAILMAGTIVIWITAFSQYCMGKQGILYREKPWQKFQAHQWTDISAIETACTRDGRGRADTFYFISMKDGTTIDIGDSMRKLESNWSRLQEHLRDVSFSFDARAVAPDCPAPRADLLRIRP